MGPLMASWHGGQGQLRTFSCEGKDSHEILKPEVGEQGAEVGVERAVSILGCNSLYCYVAVCGSPASYPQSQSLE